MQIHRQSRYCGAEGAEREWKSSRIKKTQASRVAFRYEVLGEDGDDGLMMLTASTHELRRDLVPFFYDDRAVDEEITMEREK
jgi:hypothetical protein